MVFLLELARGVAALWVFFFHVAPLFEKSSLLIYKVSLHGSLGVPMFFVISGYVITYSAESSLKVNKSPLVFLKNRFLRIYPTFWASVALVLITPYFIEAISSLKSGEYKLPENVLSKFSFIEWVNLLLLTKVFWATSSDLQGQFNTVNSVYWTLAIEFQFYVIVFIALLFGKHYRLVIAIVSLLALVVIFIPTNLNHGLFIYFWPSFSVGIALAYLHRHGVWFNPNFRKKTTYLISLLVLIIYITSLIMPELNNNSLFFSICFGMFLWLISNFERVLKKLKYSNNKLFYWLLEPWLILGSMSYSVYLLHGKINQLPGMFVRQIFDSSNILYGLLTIIGTLLICFPFYYYVESRFLSKNYKKIHQEALKNINLSS